jgi:hypothetical protein
LSPISSPIYFIGRLTWGHPLKEIGDDIGDKDHYMLDVRWML